MNEEQILELLEGFKNEILKQVDIKNGGTAASIKKDIDKRFESFKPAPKEEPTQEPESESQLTMKALQKQIAQLTEEREAQKRELAIKNRNEAVSKALGSKKVLHSDKCTRAFLMEYGDKLSEENGNYFISDGDNVHSLDESVNSFLQSDFGSLFQPPSKGVGMGLKKPEGEQSVARRSQPTLNSLLIQSEE